MNVIRKFYDALPSHWRELIEKNQWFELSQFNSCVSVSFEDGSYWFFKHAFIAHDKERDEIAIFTEHCGYHVLSTIGLENWRTLKGGLKIATNISDTVFVHDPILYPPIEKQVYDFFANQFKVVHQREGKNIVLILEGTKCGLDIKKKGVCLSIIPTYSHNDIKFGEGKYPSINLAYNKDVTKKVLVFCDCVRKLKDLEKRARKIPQPPSNKAIEAALTQQIGTDELQVSFWNDSLFTGTKIHFYIHPKGTAPADGVGVYIDADNKIKTADRIDMAAGQGRWGQINTLEMMKKKIKVIERLQAKLDTFDPSKSPELAKLIELKKRGDELVQEFDAMRNAKWK